MRKKIQMKMKVEEKASGLSRHGPALLVLFVAVLFVHDIFGAHGYLSMRRTQDGIQRVKAEIQQLNKENAALEQAVKELKTDPRAIEKIAREELILARPGEIIIKIPQSQLLPQAFNRP
jgi:cell division protein FtsL